MTNKAKDLDKYYTKSSVAEKCIKSIYCDLKDYDLILEPSAGSGSFFKKIKHKNKIGIDLEPEYKGVKKQDFFKFKMSKKYKKVLIIGNPPFGVNHSLSSKFLKNSFNFENVKTVGFVLPDVYNKHTRQKIIPNNWRIRKIVKLPKNSFEFNGETAHIPCSFFIFDKSKGRDLRVDIKKIVSIADFEFSNKKNFDLFVFGASPKKVTKRPKENNRGHYLSAKTNIEKIIKNIKNINWKGNSCANGGVYWLTQHEFASQYKEYISKVRT